MANWSELPKDLLFAIAKCIQSHFDFLRFRSVCTSWRASVHFNLIPRPSFCSRLFLRTDREGINHFVSMSSICLFKSLAESTPRFWLVKFEDDEFGKKHLFDPLYMKPVQYSMVLDLSKFDVQELGRKYLLKAYSGYSTSTLPVAYMNANSNNDDMDEDRIMAMSIADDVGHLSFMTSGEVDSIELELEDLEFLQDFIQFKRKFYAIDNLGTSVCIEPHSGVLFRLPKASTVRHYRWYFMEFCGNLLLTEMIKETDGFRFEVFQLDEEGKRWHRLESLGDGVLFLGAGGSFSAPVIPGIEGNCIVFYSFKGIVKGENGRPKMGIDAFVFDLSSGMTTPLDHRPDLLQLFRSPSQSAGEDSG